MSDFGKAFIITAISIAVLSVISMAGPAVDALYIFWFAAAVLWVIAIGAAILFAVRGRREITLGILVGIGIGIVALGGSCLANLSTYQS